MEFRVNIYIETSFQGPARKTAAGMWLIEYIKRNGETKTRQGIVCSTRTTENALALEILTLALDRLTKTCSIRVNTRCEHVLNTIRNFWLPQWEKNDWRNAKNKPVKNVEYWKKIAEAKINHLIIFDDGKNPYKTIMEDAMKIGLKELEEEKKKIQKGEELKMTCLIDLENMKLYERNWQRNSSEV